MVMKALNLSEEVPYQSMKDPDYGTDQASIYMIGVLDQKDFLEFLGFARTSSLNTPADEIYKKDVEVVLKGLRGIKRFSINGDIVDVSREMIDEKFVRNSLGVALVKELSEAIITKNLHSEIERKNSERLSSSR